MFKYCFTYVLVYSFSGISFATEWAILSSLRKLSSPNWLEWTLCQENQNLMLKLAHTLKSYTVATNGLKKNCKYPEYNVDYENIPQSMSLLCLFDIRPRALCRSTEHRKFIYLKLIFCLFVHCLSGVSVTWQRRLSYGTWARRAQTGTSKLLRSSALTSCPGSISPKSWTTVGRAAHGVFGKVWVCRMDWRHWDILGRIFPR